MSIDYKVLAQYMKLHEDMSDSNPLTNICLECYECGFRNDFSKVSKSYICNGCGAILERYYRFFIFCPNRHIVKYDNKTQFKTCSECGEKTIEMPLDCALNNLLKTKCNYKEEQVDILIDNYYFNHCRYVILGIPKKDKKVMKKQQFYNNINEAIDDLEIMNPNDEEQLSLPEQFVGHTSNLQAWVEHDYDTMLLDYKLSLPLLFELTKLKDPKAKQMFKKEMIKRIESNYIPVISYLFRQKYLKYFTEEEIKEIKNSISDRFLKIVIDNYWFKGCTFDMRGGFFIIKKDRREIIGMKNINMKLRDLSEYKHFIKYHEIKKIKFDNRVYYDLNSSFNTKDKDDTDFIKSAYPDSDQLIKIYLNYVNFRRVMNLLKSKMEYL